MTKRQLCLLPLIAFSFNLVVSSREIDEISAIMPAEEALVYHHLTTKFSVFLTASGSPLEAPYGDAEELCKYRNDLVWDLNALNEPTNSSRTPANNTIARKVLDELRRLPAVLKITENDQIKKRLNIVFGRRINETSCKYYLAGPFNDDFYTFTYNDKCSDLRNWFICENERGDNFVTPEPVTTTTTEPTPTVTDPVITDDPWNNRTSKEDEDDLDKKLEEILDEASDTSELIGNLTDLFKRMIDKKREDFERVNGWQDEVFEKVEKLVKENESLALNVTNELFESTVQALQERVRKPADFSTVVSFVNGISSRVATHMPVGTNTSDLNPDANINFIVKKVQMDRNMTSTVSSSTIHFSASSLAANTSVVTHVEFKNQSFLAMFRGQDNRSQLATNIVEFHVMNNGSKVNTASIDLFFKPKRNWFTGSDPECVFFDTKEMEMNTTGCTFQGGVYDEMIHCRCDHTTSFASLVLPLDFQEEYGTVLSYLTYALEPFSFIALSLCIVTFGFIKQLRSTSTVIHLNLCVCLLLGHTLLILSSVWLSAGEECSPFLGFITHYVFLTSIVWMGLEGYHVTHKLIVVFRSASSRLKWYITAGFLLPIIPPAATLLRDIDAYTTRNQLCFLREDRMLVFTFIFPLFLSIIINLVAVFVVFYRLTTTNRKEHSFKTNLIRFIRNLLCITSLLSLQWLFGIVAFFQKPYRLDIIFPCAVLFDVFMMLQGPTIFTLHILLVKDNRFGLARYFAEKGRVGRFFADTIRPAPPKERSNLSNGTSTKSTAIQTSISQTALQPVSTVSNETMDQITSVSDQPNCRSRT